MAAVNPNTCYRVKKGIFVDIPTVLTVEKSFVMTVDRGYYLGNNEEISTYQEGLNLLADGKTVVSITPTELPNNGKDLADAVRQIHDGYYQSAKLMWKAIVKELQKPTGFTKDAVNGVYRKTVMTSFSGLSVYKAHLERFAFDDSFSNVKFEDVGNILVVWELAV